MIFDTISDKAQDYLDEEEGMNGLLVGGIALVSSMLVKKAIEYGWRKTVNAEPPKNPADRDVSLQQALVWTLLTGVVASLVKLLVRRNVVVGARKAK